MDDSVGNAVSTLFVAGAIIAVAIILVRGLLRAGKLPPSVALVISLSLLTLVAMVGFIGTIGDSNSAELATLAGTGLGALAGAVTAVWGTDQQWRENESANKSTATSTETSALQRESSYSDSVNRPNVPIVDETENSRMSTDDALYDDADDFDEYLEEEDDDDVPDPQDDAEGAPDHPDELEDEEGPSVTWNDEPKGDGQS